MKFARITSRFSRSRFHPIRKIYRPHNGVDYAAPLGSPVQATADGVVTQVGWNGAAGRMIKIRHKNAYETMYLHLSGYAQGIRTGARVDAKQVIGYVGSSGESTGPHLDYRILYHGKYVNPSGMEVPAGGTAPEGVPRAVQSGGGEAGSRPGRPTDPRRAVLSGQSLLVFPSSLLVPC